MVMLLIALLLFLLIPLPKFTNPTCTVLTDNEGLLLGASIASDGQYRFPPTDSIPTKFEACIIEFEDNYFYSHPGVNPFSIARAAWSNIKARRVVRGGSTITQQVVRLSQNESKRTLSEKIIESILALRLEAGTSKRQILSLYASNAPFGGNVVGINAAAWRYFGRPAQELSWAESATLAVLPNSPALVHPGRNSETLRIKRNKLLKRLQTKGVIDSLSYKLSLQEPIPHEPKTLPQLAPHLLARAIRDGLGGEFVYTSLNKYLQETVTSIVRRHHERLEGNLINNAAVLILDIETNSVIAYVGNAPGAKSGGNVDIIGSPRSTGSILKPILYAAMLNDGLILPRTLIPGIPTQIGGYAPKNFNPEYDGAVPASRAIARSLNVPAVRMLQQFGVERFQNTLQKLGLTTLTRPSNEYGLSLILGGAEASLWDLAGVYAGMARAMKGYRPNQSLYNVNCYEVPRYVKTESNITSNVLLNHTTLNAASIYLCFEAMKEVARPDEVTGWQHFASSRSVAWKTGTSFGHRDGWAIGLNPQFVVAVWVGNATGEGRPNLTGVSTAAPILFDVFGLLPPSPWFDKPTDDMALVNICRHSGHRASEICTPTDSMWIPISGLETTVCPYHMLIHTNANQTRRVTDQCMSPSNMVTVPWFVLPPAMEWFYRSKNPFYKQLPPYLEGCRPNTNTPSMALIYPRIEKAQIFIPRGFDGKLSETVFEVAHQRPSATIHWHLNKQLVGTTISTHKLALQPKPGSHSLTLVDESGETITIAFRIE